MQNVKSVYFNIWACDGTLAHPGGRPFSALRIDRVTRGFLPHNRMHAHVTSRGKSDSEHWVQFGALRAGVSKSRMSI